MLKTKVITDNGSEKIVVSWDGERFAIKHNFSMGGSSALHVIILNSKEMLEVCLFVKNIVTFREE